MNVQIDIEDIRDPDDDNIEVVVTLPSGDRCWATFFTIGNIQALFEKNARTGERASGTYLPVAPNWIIVKRVQRDIIERTVADLLESEEFKSVFELLEPASPDSSE